MVQTCSPTSKTSLLKTYSLLIATKKSKGREPPRKNWRATVGKVIAPAEAMALTKVTC